MKIIDKMQQQMADGKTFFSFEFFPPRTDEVRARDLSHDSACRRGPNAQ